MKLRITIPTEARDICLDQIVEYDGKTWIVDELIHRRSENVTIVLVLVGRNPGRRKSITVDGYTDFEVLPSLDQVDELASILDAALARVSYRTASGSYVHPACESDAESDLALLGI